MHCAVTPIHLGWSEIGAGFFVQLAGTHALGKDRAQRQLIRPNNRLGDNRMIKQKMTADFEQ
jgi:hypothetical protein